MKKRRTEPQRDIRVTSRLQADGEMLISVARGKYSTGSEVLYRVEREKLLGAIKDKKELATIVNNLGLLALAQLCGFNLANSLEGMSEKLAEWGHIKLDKPSPTPEEALMIAQRTVHGRHGCTCDLAAPMEECHCTCVCADTSVQTICAGIGCMICKRADKALTAEAHEGHRNASEVGAGGDLIVQADPGLHVGPQ